jgi:hypothetical protein
MTQFTGRQVPDVLPALKTGVPVSAAGIPGGWATCTPADGTDITGCLGIYVGVTGNVSARFANAPTTTVIFVAVPAGAFIPGLFTRVMGATTAASILLATP